MEMGWARNAGLPIMRMETHGSGFRVVRPAEAMTEPGDVIHD